MAMSRSLGCRSLTRRPPITISPSETVSSPAIMLSSVDLPQPEGPTSTRNSPASTEMSMPLRISMVAEALLDAVDFERCHASSPHPFTEPAIRPRTK